MKTIIAGGRHYQLTQQDFDVLMSLGITKVINGGASGADKCASDWASKWQIPCITMYADWDQHGRAAGPIRNREMAQIAEAVVLFPGGRGTQSMYNEAVRAGLKIYDYRNMDAVESTS